MRGRQVQLAAASMQPHSKSIAERNCATSAGVATPPLRTLAKTCRTSASVSASPSRVTLTVKSSKASTPTCAGGAVPTVAETWLAFADLYVKLQLAVDAHVERVLRSLEMPLSVPPSS